ncbi:MAG: GNAT family N-acetyltransferase [Eubacteriales bacterium]|nr:GNAT family N-acetyltransferase [Eubacteriales bacterium]
MYKEIRRAQEKDINKIMELLVQVDMVHHIARPDLFKGPATKYTEEQLKAILKNDETPVFVAVDENDVVEGYAFCIFKQLPDDNILTDIKTLYIDDLCVDENIRGKHIGRKLYAYVLDFAKKQGCYNVTLNVWAENKSAMAFYEKCGLKPQKIGMEMILDGECLSKK